MKDKKPAIRFSGFSEDWEERKLKEICTYHTSSLSIGDATADGKYELYDVNKVIGFTNINVQTLDYITIIKDGSGVGRVRLLPKNTSFIGTMGAFQCNKSNLDFLFHSLIKTDFSKHITGATIPHVYFSNYGNDDYCVPKLAEQTQIGNFFKNLDTLITLHQRKYDKLVTVKKAMLEKMFPKNGADVPEIRFKGFEGAWDNQKIGNLGSVVMNRRIFKDQTSDIGDIPFYKIGTFGSEPDAFISRSLFEEYKTKYPYPVKGDILISASGSIGRTVEYLGRDEYFQDSNIVWLQHDDRILNSFLKHFYTVVKWSGLEGSTIKRLYNKSILETPIFLPIPEEQKKIGDYFNNLDNILTLHHRELEKLKNIKKAMLGKMFV